MYTKEAYGQHLYPLTKNDGMLVFSYRISYSCEAKTRTRIKIRNF